MSNNIFNEVDADVRRARLQFLWARYGWLIIGGALVLILGVAALLGINHWVGRTQEATSARYDALIAGLDGKPLADRVTGLQQFSAVEDNGYGGLAGLRAALELAETDDKAGALQQLDDFIANTRLPNEVRDFARLQASILALDMNSGNADMEVDIAARLAVLLDEDNALRALALEVLGLAHILVDKPLKAREFYLQILEEPRATTFTRQRANIMLFEVNKSLSPSDSNNSSDKNN